MTWAYFKLEGQKISSLVKPFEIQTNIYRHNEAFDRRRDYQKTFAQFYDRHLNKWSPYLVPLPEDAVRIDEKELMVEIL